MKKFFLLFVAFFLFASTSYACKYEFEELQASGETTLNLNIREVPCTGTAVLDQTKTGETHEIIGQANDYYAIMINGEERFIWKEGVVVSYSENLSSEEKILVQKIASQINSFDTFKKNIYRNKLQSLAIELGTGDKNYSLVQAILKNIDAPEEVVFVSDEATEIGKYWLELYNNYRSELGLAPYKYDIRLQKSAQTWAKISAERGYSSHRRDAGDSYYDFWKIMDWFRANGVDCKIQNRTGAVENIGHGVLYCQEGECLDALKKTVKRTFDFYMSEKGTANTAHYDSIVSPYFGYMGFGIHKKDLGGGKYAVYNVTHFCTEFN